MNLRHPADVCVTCDNRLDTVCPSRKTSNANVFNGGDNKGYKVHIKIGIL